MLNSLDIRSDHTPLEFDAYIEQGKKLAKSAGLNWTMMVSDDGYASEGTAWDLRALISDGNPLQAKLRNFSIVAKVKAKSDRIINSTVESCRPGVISESWQDLIKAYTLNHLMVLGLSLPYLAGVCNAIRLLATVKQKPLWLLTDEDFRECMAIARDIQPSGQTAVIIGAFVKTTVDTYHLSPHCPLFSKIDSARPTSPQNKRSAKFKTAETTIRDSLSIRKNAEKLPEQRAFWELIRIIFTESPRTFIDAIRFAQCKLLVLTGLRVGEISMVPLDWKRVLEYRDIKGVSAERYGGFGSATLLRHFAEKQGSKRREIGALWENTQFIPSVFETLIGEILDHVAQITGPLRKTLKMQTDSGRILPMYSPESVQPISVLYSRLTGSVLFKDVPDNVVGPYLSRYRESFDVALLDELMLLQSDVGHPARSAFYTFANRLQTEGLQFRSADGRPWAGRGVTNQFLRIDEIEHYIRAKLPTKISDTAAFRLDGGGSLQSHELIFLIPKRAVGEGRGDNPCHIGYTMGVGIATPEIIGNALTSNGPNGPSIFQTYGQTAVDQKLLLLPHSLRHLQNTELFRLGIADTIITKRFNRRSVAQSYEYDHRSLQEELDQVSLPDEWEEFLGPKANTVAKLIKAGRANGPIVAEFRHLEKTQGSEVAYSFLKGEADGFHATPYGHCLNSFTVAPCPTHLECFNGCMHLSATDLPENRRNLVALQGKLKAAVDLARSKPPSTVGRENQIQHAELRLANVGLLLATEPGERVFPEGRDFSSDTKRKDLLDGT
ncbi:hypothetical protein F2P45_18835 [Massilia sp. CCM 8733]|uniref:Integrase n=1 Tax=Massilia mucilaginosa TaxID=2609282 RepID=A0ABX0NVQ7_9BURK|nr:hypothetical protein [Massilia mucilaginosa]NHZ91056.1 hypothetical protein [Massilia mucilaginosa]